MYQLVIHHDIGLSKQNQQFTKDDWNLGHVYLELKENSNSTVYGIESGYKDSASQYFEYRPHGEERLAAKRKKAVKKSTKKPIKRAVKKT